MTIFFRSHFFL